jgi:ABC-2 type transport system permease protein
MRVFDLAAKDLKQLVRDWKAGVFLVAMPIVFTLMFGFAFGGFSSGGEEDPRLAVAVVGHDSDSLLSTSLVRLLDLAPSIRPVVFEDGDLEDLEQQVKDGELVGVVIIPTGYSDEILAGDLVALTVIVDQASPTGTTAQNEIQASVNRLLGAVQAAELGVDTYAEQTGFTDPIARKEFREEALDKAIQAWADPPLKVEVTQSGAIEVEEESEGYPENAFGHSSPSMMVQFAIAGIMGAGEILVLERKSKALQRLLTTAISRFEIILGHFLAMFTIILGQLLLLTAFGQVFLRLDYLQAPVASLIVVVSIALWVAGLGLLVGTLARKQEHVIIISLILMFVLSGLGGAWMPLEFTPSGFQAVGHTLPTAWAIDGLENIVARGLGLDSALLPAGIMLAYAIVFFVLGAWRFRFE